MKYRSFLFALFLWTIIPTTKTDRATKTPNIIQAIFAVSVLAIGPPDEGLLTASLITEGYKKSYL